MKYKEFFDDFGMVMGIVIIICFLVIGTIILPAKYQEPLYLGLIGTAILVGIAGLAWLALKHYKPIREGMIKLAHAEEVWTIIAGIGILTGITTIVLLLLRVLGVV